MAVSQVAACPAIKDQHSTPPQQVAFTRGLRWADMQTDDLASAIGVYGYSDYRGDRDDAAALALLQVGGVEQQIRPLAGERPVRNACTRSSRAFNSMARSPVRCSRSSLHGS